MSTQANDRQWKEKYLTALDEHEKLQVRQQQFLARFTRAMTRLSMLADGLDPQLDQQLNGLRTVLREESPKRSDLNTLFDALEGQVKRIDTLKSERAKIVASAFTALLNQLSELPADKPLKQSIAQLKRQAKASGGAMPYYPGLLSQLAELQEKALATIEQGGGAGSSLWQRLVGKSAAITSSDSEPGTILAPPGDDATPLPKPAPPAIAEAVYAIDADYIEAPPAAVREPAQEEPPFSRISQAICDVLNDLMQQIEPPKSAQVNYQFVADQLEKGMNWFELVPTLEELSIVVLSAFDRDQQELEQFLAALNDRLSAAYAFIAASQQINTQAAEAGDALNVSVREQVSAMQQTMDEAKEIEQLKSEVSRHLDEILSAVDRFKVAESSREQSLAEQLDSLVARVKEMELASASAEQRIEEQRQKALLDVLTQLPNREAYQLRFEQEFERWSRYRRPLSLAVCDIDYFKRINDSYGHLAGDKVLRIVAKTLAKRLRKTDFVARLGGEEFVVLLPETELDRSFQVLDALREAIAKCPFHFKDQPVSITLSFGVTECVEGLSQEQLFERADKALYAAKNGGRNCGRRAAEA